MASNAFAGVGTKFQRWNGATWDDIAEVNAIEGPGMTKDTIEVTSLDTDAGYNEFITGFAEGGTVTLDMNFTRETYELMKDDFESDIVQNYRIQLADYDSEPSTFTFGGLVIELPMGISADDKVTADVVIQVTSQVILEDFSWSSYWATRTPSALLIEALTETSIKLDWTNAGLGFDGHSIERSTDGINYAEIDTVAVGTNTYTDTVASIIKYYYRVRAYKSGNYSAYCDVAELIYGPELIVNGGFDVNANWDFGGSSSSINDGKAYLNGDGVGVWSTILRQPKVLPLATYKWSITISEYISGSANFYPVSHYGVINANGTYSGEQTASSGNYIMQFANNGVSFKAACDNISLKRKFVVDEVFYHDKATTIYVK